MALTPYTAVWGALAHLGLIAGLWLGKRLTDTTQGEGWGQRLLRDDSRAPQGQAGVAATDVPQGHPNERRSRAKPRCPICPQAS